MLYERFDAIDFRQAKQDVEPFIRDTASLNMWNADFFKQITADCSFVVKKKSEVHYNKITEMVRCIRD